MQIKLGNCRWTLLITIVVFYAFMGTTDANSCTRLLYETGYGNYIIGRSMDWGEDPKTELWAFTKGMERNGGCGSGSISWISKYGSVVAAFYNSAVVDGINEKGLAGNVLYLAESDYGDAKERGKPLLSIGAWLQYILDNYSSVNEVVKDMEKDPFTIVAPVLPNGRAASGHLALADQTGDSAIFEYIDGKLNIHHNSKFIVMTNSPIYDKQLAIDEYWKEIGGNIMLPGTYRAADRFVRASYFMRVIPKFKSEKDALASVFSAIRSVSTPLGINDPDHPNLATTVWRTVIDLKNKRYYYDSVLNPSVIWVDLDSMDLKNGAQAMKLSTADIDILAGDVSKSFKPATPFIWLK